MIERPSLEKEKNVSHMKKCTFCFLNYHNVHKTEWTRELDAVSSVKKKRERIKWKVLVSLLST